MEEEKDTMDEEFKEEVYGNETIGKKIGKFVLIVVILVILFCGLYFVWKSDLIKIPTSKQTETPEKVEDDNGVVPDEIKDQIEDKIYRILISNSWKSLSMNGNFNAYRIRTAALKRALSDEEKQMIAAYTVDYDSMVDNWKEIPKVKNAIEYEISHTSGLTSGEKIAEEYGKKTYADMNTYYHSLFGKDMGEVINDEIGKCPTIYYYDDIETFVQFPARCGGSSAGYFMTYLTDFKKNKNEITVTLCVGYGLDGPEDKVYSDFRLKDNTDILSPTDYEVIGELTDIEKDENGRYIITDTNYDRFSQYQFTFKKIDDDTYYFDKVLQLQ